MLARRRRPDSHLRVRQSLISPEPLCPIPLSTAGKCIFDLAKRRLRPGNPIVINILTPFLVVPADSGVRMPFTVPGSGPAVEFNGMFRAC
jgi:hypothetical protein